MELIKCTSKYDFAISICKTLSIRIHKAENFIRFVRLISPVPKLSDSVEDDVARQCDKKFIKILLFKLASLTQPIFHSPPFYRTLKAGLTFLCSQL